MPYVKKDFDNLKEVAGISEGAWAIHLALYEGYVKNTNKILESLDGLRKEGRSETPEYAELKRRLGWEFDGMRLHELYFGNIGQKEIDPQGALHEALKDSFGSFEEWEDDFVATGKMRGIGWAVLYKDIDGRLLNFWIDEHATGHPAGLKPLLVMDVFEHAYFPDFGKDRGAYINTFMGNIDWGTVEERFASRLN